MIHKGDKDSLSGKRHVHRVLRIIGMAIAGVVFAVLFAFIVGLVVQYLWNWLITDLFGLDTITYWQAFGLVILAKILFGGFGGHHKDHSHKEKKMFLKYRQGSNGSCSGHDRDSEKCFREYWEEEGKQAFENYMKRVNGEDKGTTE